MMPDAVPLMYQIHELRAWTVSATRPTSCVGSDEVKFWLEMASDSDSNLPIAAGRLPGLTQPLFDVRVVMHPLNYLMLFRFVEELIFPT
ncbi:hypothetical protein J1614_003064 [Plenodomus biglobosus]|nr:hypothetical protein J1614_003064 [Plenodomus biglobosus]